MRRQRAVLSRVAWLAVLLVVTACARPLPRVATPTATPRTATSQATPALHAATPPGTASAVPPPTREGPRAQRLENAGAPGIGDPYYPAMGNGGYDVTHYTLTLEIEPATNEVTGTARIEARALQPLSALNLDFANLTADEVKVDGAAAAFVAEDGELTVTLPALAPELSQFTVEVTYHGRPRPLRDVATPSNFLVGWFRSSDGTINVMSEPGGSRSWYPVNDHPRDKATYRFEITVPEPWVVAATGRLEESVDLEDRTRYVFEMDRPMASYLASINIGKYQIETSQGPGGVRIRNYVTSQLAAGARTRVDEIPEMMDYLSGLFGPYPFDEYGILVAESTNTWCRSFAGALETQTLAIHCPDTESMSEDAVVHELAHQWFGDSVSLENWRDVWLKEGMATYAEWLWQTREGDISALTEHAAAQLRNSPQDSPIGRPPPDSLYDWETYIGGAIVFQALRLEVGDDAFFRTLHTYLERFRYGNAGTDEFIALAEEASGQELSAFFDAWLMHPTLPQLPAPSQLVQTR